MGQETVFHNGPSLLQGLSNLFMTKTLTKILWLISYIRPTALHIEIVSIYVHRHNCELCIHIMVIVGVYITITASGRIIFHNRIIIFSRNVILKTFKGELWLISCVCLRFKMIWTKWWIVIILVRPCEAEVTDC